MLNIQVNISHLMLHDLILHTTNFVEFDFVAFCSLEASEWMQLSDNLV